MKNDTRSGIFNKHAAVSVRFSVLVCFSAHAGLMPLTALADTGLPPPAVHQTTNNSFPSAQALKRQGYDPSTGVLRVNENNRGSSTVTKTGDTITGQQNKSVTVTGNYGEKGTMSTSTTQRVSAGKLQTTVNGIVIAGGIGNGARSATDEANKMGAALAAGNYGQAAYHAYGATARFIDGIFGSPMAGLFDLAKSAIDGYNGQNSNSSPSQQANQLGQAAQQATAKQAQAERKGDLGGAIAQAAAAKAAQGAAQAAKLQSSNAEKIDKLPGQTVYQAFASIFEKSGSRTVYYPFYVSSDSDSMPSFSISYTRDGKKG
ncbi:TspB protein, partial [Neisseria weixii]